MAIYLLNQMSAIYLFGSILILFIIGEYLRMTNKTISALTSKYFSAMMRDHENTEVFSFKSLTGSFYFLLAVLISVVLFSKQIAMASVTIMILSDTIAALVGKSIGRISILDKTMEGSLAFLITSYTTLFFMVDGLSLLKYLLISAIVTLVELVSNKIHINDNLSITICSGLLILFLKDENFHILNLRF